MEVTFDHLLDRGALYPYQTVGVAVALVERRCFIADEMGLGKTLQALTAIEADQAFPAVIVCPAGLKDNWVAEISHWLPHRKAAVLRGTGSDLIMADFLVVGWPGLSTWQPALSALSPRALVLDEGHYAANASQRTDAAKKLAESLPEGALRLDLTGTPINNRPEDLIPQLEILDRLHDIAPPPRFGKKDERAWRDSFRKAFCGKAGDPEELHRRLRGCCYIRRERSEVGTQITAQGFSETRRNQVHLSLNGDLEAYREAEEDLVRFLYETRGAEAARGAVRAQALNRITVLRQLAGRAKVPAAIEWIDNFMVSNPGRSLIVFAHHEDVQKAIANHYGCPTLLGGERDPEASKRAFMAGEHQLIVCSLSAAREGHTLTRAHDVLFVEQAWTPGAMQQAEDRANRIGQTAPEVFAWTLLAEDTIDLRVAEILKTKKLMFRRVAVGDSALMAEALLDEYERQAVVNV